MSLFFFPPKLPHTSKEVLPLRPNPASNGTQPVNIVRPLRPAPSPSLSNIKGPRPPPPIGKPPNSPSKPKSVASPQKLSPPKKPLPLNPSRTPLVRVQCPQILWFNQNHCRSQSRSRSQTNSA